MIISSRSVGSGLRDWVSGMKGEDGKDEAFRAGWAKGLQGIVPNCPEARVAGEWTLRTRRCPIYRLRETRGAEGAKKKGQSRV